MTSEAIDLKLEQELLELEYRQQAVESLDHYCRYIEIPGAPLNDDEECEEFYPDNVTPAEHHTLLNTTLQQVESGEIPRLMVFMPPGSAKSTYGTVTFPTWFMGKNPGKNVICTSYGTSLAEKFSRKCRQIAGSTQYSELFGAQLNSENRSVKDWSISNNATYMAGGILSGITGNRADLLVIDDPIKGREQADSDTIREKTWDAYLTDLRTRLKPSGRIVVIQTRWHEDDLSGRILPDNYDGESGWVTSKDGEQWFVICLQAECERDDDPLGREIGEWLWPDWFTPEHWRREKKIQGERNWSALYQQRPKPSEGAMIKRKWIKRYKTPPAEFIRILHSWDTAYKEGELNDPSACTVWGETKLGYYLLYVWKDKVDYPELKRTGINLYKDWNPQALLIEDKASGQSLIQEFKAGVDEPDGSVTAPPTIPIDTEGQSKMVRLVEVSPLFEAGYVYLPESAPWLMEYESELFGYPLTTHDDQVDSTSQFLKWAHRHRVLIAHHRAGGTRAGLVPDFPSSDDDDDELFDDYDDTYGGFI